MYSILILGDPPSILLVHMYHTLCPCQIEDCLTILACKWKKESCLGSFQSA